MSYQLDLERGKKVEIEMPPIEEQTVIQQEVNKEIYEMHPKLQNTVPDEVSQHEEQESRAAARQSEEIEEEVIEKPKPETAQAKNFRQIREQKDRLEWERDELRRRLDTYEANKPQVKEEFKQEYEEPDLDINPDDLVEGKHLNKYAKKLKEIQKDLKLQQQQNQLTATEIRLKHEFPDFDKVVSNDNINQLRSSYPELAETLNSSSSDLYSKAKSAYTLIKKLGISNDDVYQQDRERVAKNSAKPRPVAAVSPQQGDSPLSKANAFAGGLTEDLKAQLRKEMYAYRNN